MPRLITFTLTLFFATAATALRAAPEDERARRMLAETGVTGGLVVHLGCGAGELTVALRANERYLVHGLDADAAKVAAARGRVQALELDGKVSFSQLTGGRLPHADNLANLIVAENPDAVPRAEIMRVLAPLGVAYIRQGGKWTKTVKPWPAELDEWTHYLHGADGNAVAQDTAVGPPRRVQWEAGPRFGRHHDVLASISAIVSAGGRLFYIIDEGPPSLMHYQARWRLVARDAFNGVLLWKRAIPEWEDHLRPFRSGPPQLPRRLVAAGDSVYVTLGLDAPVSRLDAATGEILRTYRGTEGADEILLSNDVLLLVILEPPPESATAKSTRGKIPSAPGARGLTAVNADTGEALWRKSGEETAGMQPLTLAATGGRALFQHGSEIRCLTLATGEPVWTRALSTQTKAAPQPAEGKQKGKARGNVWSQSYYAPTLVVSEREKVVLAAARGKLTALALDDGRPLWSCPCQPDFHAPADVFLAGGLVWAGLFATEGRDPRTGEVKRNLDITGLLTAGHHPRCYRNKATERFVIANKRGLEFFDLQGGQHSRNNWVRGGCQYGILPCNGLNYIPPNACCCYPGVMVHGLYALAPEGGTKSEERRVKSEGPRLINGPAYAGIKNEKLRMKNGGGWTSYRGNALRGGSTADGVAPVVKKAWQTPVGGKLTAPVLAGGRLLVCDRERGRVVALNAGSGEKLWSFTAGGRIDTPPTIYDGRALFGATDGWAYCLDAASGALAWRFRAGPHERLIVADERLESTWPVPGNVLVLDGVAYFAAGRSCYLDGGLRLYGLDARTGELKCETSVAVPHDEDESVAFVMAGARPDILVSDGKYIYLQQLKFDRQLVRQPGFGRHLMNHSGLADDTWFYRTFWRLGYGDAFDFPNSYIKHDLRVPFGQLLAFNDELVCGVQMRFSPGIVPSGAAAGGQGGLLFGDDNQPFTPDVKTPPDSDYPPGKMTRRKLPVDHKWTADLPFQARAMVLAGETLFVAGWPEVTESKDSSAAFAGGASGVLWAFDASSGKKLSQRKLDSPPVFDGLIATGGRLYLSLKNGAVLCLGPDS